MPISTTMSGPLRVGGKVLSDSAERVLRFIKDYAKTTNGMPTIREIMRYLGFRSTNSVYKQLKKLEEAGEITKQSNGRLLLVERRAMPFAGTASAGFAAPVKEGQIEMMSLDEFLIQKPERTFLLSVSGDSMIGAGILDGDYILVERGAHYDSGSLVVVNTDTGYVVKRYIAHAKGAMLRSANPTHKDMPFQEGWVVFGPVIAVVRKTIAV